MSHPKVSTGPSSFYNTLQSDFSSHKDSFSTRDKILESHSEQSISQPSSTPLPSTIDSNNLYSHQSLHPHHSSSNYCNNTLDMYEQSQVLKAPSMSVSSLDWEYPFISKTALNKQNQLSSEKNDNSKINVPSDTSNNNANNSRWQSSYYERETIWGEIRLYSEHLRRYASEVPHPEVTREKFFEIYNLAVGMLRAIDCLDPDYKMRKSDPCHYSPSSEYLTNQRSDLRREIPSHYNETPPPYHPHYQTTTHAQIPMKNLTGEVFFDDLADSERYPKRKRKKSLYSVNRNLYCHICFVRETPEWRRGPDGDHTLCNACGLHYAKTQKKEKLAREGRKHSIEMLLCENDNSSNNTTGIHSTTNTTNGKTGEPNGSSSRKRSFEGGRRYSFPTEENEE